MQAVLDEPAMIAPVRFPVRAQVMAASIVGNMLSSTPIVRVSFGVLLIPMALEFGWPRAQLSGAITLYSIITAIMYPILGRIVDIAGARRLIVWGTLAFGCSVAALALGEPDMLWFYLLYAVVGVTGALPSTMLFNRVISAWFDKKRGTMLGLSAGLGNGIGTTIMPVITAVLLSMFGWRGAFVGLGLLVLIVALPTQFFLLKETKPDPLAIEEAGVSPALLEGMSLRQAARTAPFWMILLAFSLGAGVMSAAASHIIPILAGRGYGLATGAAVISTYAMVCAGWQIVVGWLLDKAQSPKIVAPFYVVSVLGLLLLEGADSVPLLLAGGVLLGIGMGAEYGALPYLVSRYFGMKHFGAISGVVYSTVILAQGVCIVLTDVDYDLNKSYNLALHVIDLTIVFGAILLMLMRPFGSPAWRRKLAEASATQ
jgi:MFS family permease